MPKVRRVVSCGFCSEFHNFSVVHKFWKSVRFDKVTEFKGGNFCWDTVYIIIIQKKYNWHQPSSSSCSIQKTWVCDVFPASQLQSDTSSRPLVTVDRAGSTCGVASGAGHAVPTVPQASSSCHMVAGYLQTLWGAPVPPCHGAACEATYLTQTDQLSSS